MKLQLIYNNNKRSIYFRVFDWCLALFFLLSSPPFELDFRFFVCLESKRVLSLWFSLDATEMQWIMTIDTLNREREREGEREKAIGFKAPKIDWKIVEPSNWTSYLLFVLKIMFSRTQLNVVVVLFPFFILGMTKNYCSRITQIWSIKTKQTSNDLSGFWIELKKSLKSAFRL